MGVEVAAKAEDIQTSLSSSSSSSSSSSRSLSLSSRSTQNSNNSSSCSSDVAAGTDPSSTEANRSIIHIGLMHECIIGVEGRGISTQNAGQLLHLPLTSQLVRAHTSRTAAISLLLQYRICNLDHHLRASHTHHLSRYRCLRHRAHHHNHRLTRQPLRHHRMNRRFHPRSLTGTLHLGPSQRTSRLQATFRVYL